MADSSFSQAILVHIELPQGLQQEDLIEFKLLVRSAGMEVLDTLIGQRRQPEPKYFIGGGKLEELKVLVDGLEPHLVIFNHNLSASQVRELEQYLKCRVIDRTELILDIFAQRAQTYEGKLQVELAQLEHLATRLVHGWSHLERQKGGIGLRGPGEKQLETDRRLLRERVKMIKKRLTQVLKQRQQNRRARKRADVPTIALVGYTNAGKSTLFNWVTGADVYAADQLFATLDPTHRRVMIPGFGPVVLVDTVGFIRHLPHDLVAAFQATLQETAEADLLLQIVDVTDEDLVMHRLQVEDVLQMVGADSVKLCEVFNKIDLLEGEMPKIVRDPLTNEVKTVWVSAVNAQGLAPLQTTIAELLGGEIFELDIEVSAERWNGDWEKMVAALYQCEAVLGKRVTDSGVQLSLRVVKSVWRSLSERFGVDEACYQPLVYTKNH